MAGVVLSSLLGGLAAGLFFLIFIMRGVERQKEAERKKEEARLAAERRKAVYEEARRIKAEMDAQKAEARERAREYVSGIKGPETVNLSGVYASGDSSEAKNNSSEGQ